MGNVFGVFILFIVLIIVLKSKQRKKMKEKILSVVSGDMEKAENMWEVWKTFQRFGDGDLNKFAYILATAKHESGFKPVRECFAKSDIAARSCLVGREYAKSAGVYGHAYYGRGYVQLTWLNNYKKMSDLLGIDLVQYPDKALEKDVSALILVRGMMEGHFTRKKLSEYINEGSADFVNARRTVNGIDRAALIAGYAEKILKILNS